MKNIRETNNNSDGAASWQTLLLILLAISIPFGLGFALIGHGASSAQIQVPAPDAKPGVDPLKMLHPRWGHSATLLPDGQRVLITGGTDQNGSVEQMELFDAATRLFRLPTTQDLEDAAMLTLGPVAPDDNTVDLVTGATLWFGLDHVLLVGPDGTTQNLVGDNTPLRRASASATTLTAPPEQANRILIVGGKDSTETPQDAALFNPARLETDKDDYQPDDNVILHGTGWKPGETVDLYIVDDLGWVYDSTATADANGEFLANPFFVVLFQHLGVTFDLTGIGGDSKLEAKVRFTDASSSTVTTYASDCTTTLASFCLGATVCAKGSGVTGGNHHLEWFDASDFKQRTSSSSSTDFSDSFTPATSGNWSIKLVKDSNSSVAASTPFTVNITPSITVQPSPSTGTTTVGLSRTYSVTATGATTYQWRKGGLNLANSGDFSGVTTSTLTINPVNLADAGSYDVVVGNAAGCTVTSTAVTLSVNQRPVANTDSYSVNEDNTLTVAAPGVLTNDSDPDGNTITVDLPAPIAGPSNGSVTLNANGSFTYTPNANFNGTDTFTYKAKDSPSNALSASAATVTINVTAVNDAPSFVKGADQTVLEDAGAQSVLGWATAISAGPVNESGQTVDFIVSNNNNGLFSTQPAVAANGTLTYTPAANANGSAIVTIVLHDSGGTANGGIDTSASQTFTIYVTAVNDAPSSVKGADQTVLEDAGAQSVPGWATAISAGPANESGQTVDFIVSNNNTALFSAQPAVSPTGTLTYTPAANANGSATVSVQIHDNGGTANNGVDTSATQTFTITVTAVNDAPTATNLSAAPDRHRGG
jgi:VCBS repeat-containing protein